jgi:hypothetical protein
MRGNRRITGVVVAPLQSVSQSILLLCVDDSV